MPKPITVTEMNAWSDCPMLRYWSFEAGSQNCGIEPTELYLPFLEGRFLHHTVAIFNRTGKMMKMALLKWFEDSLTEWELSPDQRDEVDVAKYRAYGACIGYRDKFPEDPQLNWLGIEQPFEFQFKGYTFAGRIDGVYESSEGLVVREYKFLSKGSQLAPVALPLNLQRWVYTMGAKALYGKWPELVEFRYVFKTRIRQKKGETLGEFEKRNIDAYTGGDEGLFYNQRMLSQADAIENVFSDMMEQRLLIMTSRKPWMNDRNCVRPAGRPCPFLPACTALLQGQRQGWMAPQCIKLYREKKARNPELLETS